MSARRITRVVVLIALLCAALLPNAVAQAAPYVASATLSASSSDPCVGGRNSYSGAGFVPGETVTLTVDGHTVATAVAEGNGSFTVGFSLPTSYRGTVVITATGSKAGASTTVTVFRSCSAPSGGAGVQGAGASQGGGAAGVEGAGTSGGSSSPAVTGVAVVTLLVAALALLGGGAFLVVTGRRRTR